ncbi:hypothetical protein CA606_09130 [Caulobacter vibrioides]|uniref:Uncharacterized protein n=1 Tax=Caulobacter vibrioides TaxID=155892 RepID=A0A290MVV8_CAUVI|nr:hypothetical protein [Caulobacter vibrioides]ATC32499.1 hypothetical protein CA606_09130 [Caulobacter vibrioides]
MADGSSAFGEREVRFVSLYHHDGRFVRREGAFAFCRRDADGGRTVLHLESAADISRVATPGHAHWDWAVANGMNELLISVKEGQPVDKAIALSDLRFALPSEATA